MLPGEGVGSAVSKSFENVIVAEAEYCAYAVLQRSIVLGDKQSFTAGDFVGSIKGLSGIQLLKDPYGSAA